VKQTKEDDMTTESYNMPFKIKDCALITRMAGIDTAMTLRELQARISACSIECLFHHFCETVLRATFDDPEYRNDLAVWAAHQLRDKVLAERLAIINPYSLDSFEDLRLQVMDIIDERLAELDVIPSAPRGSEFHFMQAVTVVFDTGVELVEPEDLRKHLPNMSLGSIYYHFVEARRRTDEKCDDFTAWLMGFDNGIEPLAKALASIDFYFLTLSELKSTLIQTVDTVMREMTHA